VGFPSGVMHSHKNMTVDISDDQSIRGLAEAASLTFTIFITRGVGS
jgi:hypothetical protein